MPESEKLDNGTDFQMCDSVDVVTEVLIHATKKHGSDFGWGSLKSLSGTLYP